MIEAFELDMYRANVYALLWAILGVSTGTLLLEIGVAKAEVGNLVSLILIISMVYILWGAAWNVVVEPFYLDAEAGETA
jgi:hypothetical protein